MQLFGFVIIRFESVKKSRQINAGQASEIGLQLVAIMNNLNC